MDTSPLHLLLGTRLDAPGVAELLDRAAATGRPLRVLLTADAAQEVAQDVVGPAAQQLLAAARDAGLCTQAARRHGLSPDRTPPGLRWTSVATWHVEAGPDAEIWSALP